MASNEPDKALSNIDDLVAAQAYYKDDKMINVGTGLTRLFENRLKNLFPFRHYAGQRRKLPPALPAMQATKNCASRP